MYRIYLAAMLCGFLIDCVLGDPVGIPHPVVMIGKAISRFEKLYRDEFPKDAAGERKAGICMNLSVLFLTAVISGAVILLCKAISKWLCFAVCTVLCWQVFAAKCLKDEAMKVSSCLENDGLDAGRKQVAMLVGRDTENLSEEQVIKAAVETVAENTSDGVIAPMFWMFLGGPVMGLLYKAVNTMDSMVGYKNKKYMDYGRFAARLDDEVNYIPARLAALELILAAFLTGMDGKNAWRIWKRDRRNHASPNSAQTESAVAGALGLRLAGDAVYFGKLTKKPYIGDALRDIEPEDIRRSHKLMFTATGEMLVLALAGMLLAHYL